MFAPRRLLNHLVHANSILSTSSSSTTTTSLAARITTLSRSTTTTQNSLFLLCRNTHRQRNAINNANNSNSDNGFRRHLASVSEDELNATVSNSRRGDDGDEAIFANLRKIGFKNRHILREARLEDDVRGDPSKERLEEGESSAFGIEDIDAVLEMEMGANRKASRGAALDKGNEEDEEDEEDEDEEDDDDTFVFDEDDEGEDDDETQALATKNSDATAELNATAEPTTAELDADADAEQEEGADDDEDADDGADVDDNEDLEDARSDIESGVVTEADMLDRGTEKEFLVKEVLKIGRHIKVTANGRMQSYSALVLLGDGNGTAGYGYGKALTPEQATLNAARDAEKYMFSVPLTDDHRLVRGFKVKHDGATVIVQPVAPRMGVNGGDIGHLLCEAFGVTDVIIKAIGRTGIQNVVRAFFKGMHDHTISQRALAEGRGMKYFDPRRDYRYPSRNPSRTPAGAWSPSKREEPWLGDPPLQPTTTSRRRRPSSQQPSSFSDDEQSQQQQ